MKPNRLGWYLITLAAAMVVVDHVFALLDGIARLIK